MHVSSDEPIIFCVGTNVYVLISVIIVDIW